MKIFKNKEKKQIFLSAILLVIIIALYVEFNLLISKMKIKNVDITESKVYSVSDESIEKIKGLDKEAKIYLIGFDKYKDYSYINDLNCFLDDLNCISDKISIESYDEYENDNNNNDKTPYMIFECEGRTRKVTVNELFQYKYNTLSEYEEEMYIIEPVIVNSLLTVANNSENYIYILYNKSIYSDKMYLSFVNIAGSMGFETYVINIEEDKSIPNNCKCLVVPPLVDENVNPTDLSNEEKDIIVDYINNGGNILFLQESKSLMNGETPNLDYIIGLYGMSISDGIVCQLDDSVKNAPSYIYPKVVESDICKAVNNDSKINVFDAGIINFNEDSQLNVKHQIIIQAGSNAFLRNDMTNKSLEKTENDIDVPNAVIGAYAEKNIGEKQSKAILYTNSVIATNSIIPFPNSLTNKKIKIEAIIINDNSDLIADSINFLVNNSESIYNTKTKYHLVPSMNILTDGITLKIIFVIPMIIIFIGFIIWRYRKNKK